MALKKEGRFARTAQRNRLGVAIAAALALPASALAQEALEEIVVTARFREENLQQTPLAITAYHRRLARSARRDEHARPRRVRAERGHRAARRRLGLDGRRVHSRHRLGRQLAVVRARRADLHRRRLSRPSARRRPGPARHRARRGAARPARHAVRQEHARRCRADHFAQTRGRQHRLHRRRRRLARPLEPARVVRLRARRRQSVCTRVGVVENAGRLLRHSRLRMRQRSGLARRGRSRHRRGHERRRAAGHGARSDESRVDLVRREHPPRDRRRAARQRARHHRRARLRRRPLRQRGRAVGTRRGAIPRVRYCRGQRRRRLDLQRPAGRARQVHRATAHRLPACRPASRRRSTTGTTTSRSRCSVPAGSSTGVSKRRTSTRATTASAKTR